MSIQDTLAAHSEWVRSRFKKGHRADFSDLDLSGVDLRDHNLSGAKFFNTNLSGARLTDTIFHGSNLGGAVLDGATMFDTVFRRVDLSRVSGLENVIHHGPSTIGLDTLLRSKGSVPEAFLIGAGMPQESVAPLLEWARVNWKKYLSVFISYGGPDEDHARAIYEEFVRRGVAVFFFPENAIPGTRLSSLMSNGIYEYERVVLVCSERSLARSGVRNEIQETLDREAAEGGTSILIPVTLDDEAFGHWSPDRPDLSRGVKKRVVADFRKAWDGDEEFAKAMNRLSSAILKKTWAVGI